MQHILIAVLVMLTAPAHAVYISTTSSASAQGLSWASGDLVNFELIGNTKPSWVVSMLFDGSDFFTNTENIDAAAWVGDDLVFSTSTDAQIGALNFLDGDLVKWDTSNNTFELFLSESIFGGTDEDIDAVHVFDDGTLALSTTSSANLSGMSFRSRDVVRYNPITEAVSLIFDGDLFDTTGENIDAVIADETGDLILSTSTDAIVSGVSVHDGDLWLYDGATVSILFTENIFDGDEDINAAAVATAPTAASAPPSLSLLLAALILMRRKL